MSDPVFDKSKCDIGPEPAIDRLPTILPEELPTWDYGAGACIPTPIVPLAPEIPCPEIVAGPGEVYIQRDALSLSISEASFEITITKGQSCAFEIGGILKLPRLGCPTIEGVPGQVLVGTDENELPITVPSSEITVTQLADCKFQLLSRIRLPSLGDCPEFTTNPGGDSISLVEMTGPQGGGHARVTIAPGDNCTFDVSVDLRIKSRPVVSVLAPNTLPGGYNGNSALASTAWERTPSGSVLPNKSLGAVWLASGNGVPLTPSRYYNARHVGDLTQGGVTRPLYLTEEVEAVVKTPFSISASFDFDNAIIGTFIVRDIQADTDVEAGTVFIRELNHRKLTPHTKYVGAWTGPLTQGFVTLPLVEVAAGTTEPVEGTGYVRDIYCSAGVLFVLRD